MNRPARLPRSEQHADTAVGKTLARRRELLDALAGAALEIGSRPVSLRQFAIQAGVSEPTLRHYFNDRQGVVVAIMEHLADGARDWLERAAAPGGPLEDSLTGFAAFTLAGLENDLFVRAHSFALVEAIHDPVAAEAYRRTMIDPSLKAIEARIAHALGDGARSEARARDTAFAFYAALLFAILHQGPLGGRKDAPLDIGGFLTRLSSVLARGVEGA